LGVVVTTLILGNNVVRLEVLGVTATLLITSLKSIRWFCHAGTAAPGGKKRKQMIFKRLCTRKWCTWSSFGPTWKKTVSDEQTT